jgi:SMODS-associating 4TM effector domain
VNTIAQDQNSPPFLLLLKARQRVYREATGFQIVQLIATVLLPLAGAALATFVASSRPWVALYGLIVTVIDVFWIDRSQRDRSKTAAKISEKFDCGALRLPWNAFAVGKQINAETIDAAARKWSGDERKLLDWYSDIDGTAPLGLARVVCQRTNLWYDSSLRRSYGKVLVCLVVIVVLMLVLVASLRDLPFLDLVAVAATVSPTVIWAARERYRQLDAADSAEMIMAEAEKLLEQVRAGGCSDAECERRSREFQDAIYARRVANPLILPLIYWKKRPEMEKRMKAGIESNLTGDSG